jgi:hypothetical protein
MLIDKQAPPSDENFYIRQSDLEILVVFQGHLFTSISPFLRNLRKVLIGTLIGGRGQAIY